MKFYILLLIALFSPQLFAKTGSVYTSLFMDDCITIDSSDDYPDAEIDFLESECASYGGYKLTVSGSDLRYAVRLKYNGKEIPTARIEQFHDLASDKAEWRYEVTGPDYKKTLTYTSLIYRLSYLDYDQKKQKNFEHQILVVMRLNGEKSCLLGVIEKSKDMNMKARALADNKSAVCQ